MTLKETSTKVPPSEPGWYWIRLRGEAATVVQVVRADTGGVRVLVDGDLLDPFTLDARWGETPILRPHQRLT